MKQTRRVISLVGIIMGILWSLTVAPLFAQEGKDQKAQATTRTIIGDLLDVDRDFYIVRGPRGEIQIEATGKTEITEEFGYGDRIKAIVLPNNKALIIERAGAQEPSGITENVPAISSSQKPNAPTPSVVSAKPDSSTAEEPTPFKPMKPDTKTIIADLLDIDGDFYVVRSEHGEIRIEATPDTKMTEEFTFGDRIKAIVSMTDTAFSIERASPNDVPGIIVHRPASSKAQKVEHTHVSSDTKKAEPTPSQSPPDKKPKPEKTIKPEIQTVEGQILMIDGDFYVLRGEQGEIRIEVTPNTQMTETFKFNDRIKATMSKNDKAIKIERAP